jgi:SDR family mycofactocin-dependent oxidoreductase
MAGRVAGKVAFITGAARGQGRSHAVRLAEEGAGIIGIDICADVETVGYPGATADDLKETARMVEALDRRAIFSQADVRDPDAVAAAVSEGVAELGRLDIVVANAGILTAAPATEMTRAQWLETIDINLNGPWWTCQAAIPHLIAGGRGGSIIMTASRVGYLTGAPNLGHYSAAKAGVIGLMKTLSIELAAHSIRVNTVNPTNCNTPMLQNDYMMKLFFPDDPDATRAQFEEACKATHNLPIAWTEPVDVSNAVLYLASDEARYVTGISLSVGEA